MDMERRMDMVAVVDSFAYRYTVRKEILHRVTTQSKEEKIYSLTAQVSW